MERLKALLAKRQPTPHRFDRGFIPNHYKRLNISMKDAFEIACFGAEEVTARFPHDRLYFTQALIAGAILSRRFHTVTICTPSQYGKSWTLGRVCITKADMGFNTYVAAATGELTNVIMGHFMGAIQDADQELQTRIIGVDLNEIQKLGKTASKKRVSIADGGFTEAISLADTYADKKKTGAMGKGDDYVVDEAALVSPQAFGELGRRDFAGIDGERKQLVMVSNPHKPGYFYDHLTEENPDDKTLIIWADALTAVEEGQFTEEQVLNSDFAKNPSERIRYLLCELESHGFSMFDEPQVENLQVEGITTLGVDAAYKGKDKITLCRAITYGEGQIYIPEIVDVDKPLWVEGETSKEVIDAITRVYHYYKAPYMCVDTGQGIWLNEGLKNNGLNTKGIGFGEGPTKARVTANQYSATNAQNMRAEMHLDLQDLIAKKCITFSEQAYNAIKATLPLVSMERKGKKIQIRPKPEIKQELGHSPDAFDALLLAVHAAIIYNAENYGY